MMKAKLKVPKSKINSIYRKHGLYNDNYFQIYFGGSSSGKSYFLAQRAALDVVKGRNILVVRKVKNTVRGSVFNEIKKQIINLGLAQYFRINKSEMTITCKLNNRQIKFGGLDDVEKIKSITPIDGVFTDIWIEEATEITESDFKQLKKRLRGESKHKKRVTLSFNPVHKTHWIYEHFFKEWRDGEQYIETEVDGLPLSILKTTYKDNEYLTEQDVANLENETDQYFYDVYTLGKWGVLGDVIFTNWETADLSKMKIKFDYYNNGIDFGFTNDPSTIIRCGYNERTQTLYILDEWYQHGATNDVIARKANEMCGNELVVCDSAEPKSIFELNRMGVNAVGAEKGKDSVNLGIDWLKRQNIVIDEHCINTISEFRTYKWKQNKEGQSINQPEDKNNHCIDAIRYACEVYSMAEEEETIMYDDRVNISPF
ncbi:MAG: PBSX family phage terminase large subunit [bacterium]